MTYLDVVVDENYQPIIGSNKIEGDLAGWIADHPEVNVPGNMVCVGRTLKFMSVQEYIDKHGQHSSRERKAN